MHRRGAEDAEILRYYHFYVRWVHSRPGTRLVLTRRRGGRGKL